jgi:hypothetical protein
VSCEDLRAEVEVLVPLAEACERVIAHLQANGVDLAKTPLTLGRRCASTARARASSATRKRTDS